MEDEWVGCDGPRCPARAYVHAVIGRATVSYCGHHAEKYWTRLHEVADQVIDQRFMIPN